MKSRVSSTVTKRTSNPRPRKYASASERQAAYRARAPEVCFRAEAKTVETLDRIAETLDQSRANVLLSMTKFALANHDWARFGLTHKPLPFEYGVNPIMSETLIYGLPRGERERYTEQLLYGGGLKLSKDQIERVKAAASADGWHSFRIVDFDPTAKPDFSKAVKRNPTMKAKRKPTPAQRAARERFAEMARSGAFKRKANPRPRKASADDAFDPMQGFGPRKGLEGPFRMKNGRIVYYDPMEGAYYDPTTDIYLSPDESIALIGRSSNPAKKTRKTVSQKISQLTREGYPQKQAVAIALNEERAGKVKRNPVKYRDIAKGAPPARVQYAVHMPDRPSYHAMAYFTRKADAVETAQEVSDRTGKPVAVTRVQVHFGPL